MPQIRDLLSKLEAGSSPGFIRPPIPGERASPSNLSRDERKRATWGARTAHDHRAPDPEDRQRPLDHAEPRSDVSRALARGSSSDPVLGREQFSLLRPGLLV